MADQPEAAKSGSFTRTVAKKALAPVVTSAATAATAYLMRKGAELWQEKLQPKIEERGGGRAVASEALEGLRERLPDSATEKLETLGSKAGSQEEAQGAASSTTTTASDDDREKERRKREQRRQQRRR
ncbi:MAG: hypothetical protein ACJ76O_02400, partial [Gaiellaceae bacterium]